MSEKEVMKERYEESYGSQKYKFSFSWIKFLPIMLLLGLVPLVMRASLIEVDVALYTATGKAQHMDFYTQYKAILIMMLTGIMVITSFLTMSKQDVKRGKEWSIVYISMGIYMVLTILSTVFSDFKNISLWGVYDRAEGLWILISYVVILLYVAWVIKEEKDFKYIWGPLAVTIIATTILGMFQYVNKDPFLTTELGNKLIMPEKYANFRDSIQNNFQNTMYGMMYNPNYVGSFAAMMIPMFSTLTLFYQDKKLKVVFAILTVLSGILLVGSGSAAGIVGVGFGMVLFCVLFSKKLIKSYKITGSIVILGIIIILGLNAYTNGGFFGEIGKVIDEVGAIFTPAASDYDYKDYAPIRWIEAREDVVLIEKNQGTLFIESDSQGEGLTFYDEQGTSVVYERVEDEYTTNDERFKELAFSLLKGKEQGVVFFRVDHEGINAFIGGVKYKDKAFLLNPLSMFTTELVDAPYIGFEGKEKLGSGRGYIWSRSLPLLKNTILLGNGPDTFQVIFPQNDHIAKWMSLGSPQIIVDKPHNYYLQLALNQGVLALIAFIVFVTAYIIQSIRLYFFKSYYMNIEVIGIAMVVAVVGYLGAAFFNDSIVSVAPIFWALLGCGLGFNSIVKRNNELFVSKRI